MTNVDPRRDTTGVSTRDETTGSDQAAAEHAAQQLVANLPADLAAGRNRLRLDATSAAVAAADALDGLAAFLVAHEQLERATSALAGLIAQRTGHDRADTIYSALRDDHHDSDDVVSAVENTWLAALVHEADVAPAAAELHALAARLRSHHPEPPTPAAAAPPTLDVVHQEVERRIMAADRDRPAAEAALHYLQHASPDARPDALAMFERLPAGDRYSVLFAAIRDASPQMADAALWLDVAVGERLAAERDMAVEVAFAAGRGRPAGDAPSTCCTPPSECCCPRRSTELTSPTVLDEVRCRRLVIVDDLGHERIVAEIARGDAVVSCFVEGPGGHYDRTRASLYASNASTHAAAGVAGMATAGDGNVETVFDLVAQDHDTAPEGFLTLYADDGNRHRTLTVDGDHHAEAA